MNRRQPGHDVDAITEQHCIAGQGCMKCRAIKYMAYLMPADSRGKASSAWVDRVCRPGKADRAQRPSRACRGIALLEGGRAIDLPLTKGVLYD